ncbi:zinc finger protein CONSTANS-LIKE [Trifolium repens]|nr:zinc finger protein CONSTANS-LIKE [Trifolium repens]
MLTRTIHTKLQTPSPSHISNSVSSLSMEAVFILHGNIMLEISNCGYIKVLRVDHEARVLRIKEKIKNRRFEKTIHDS